MKTILAKYYGLVKSFIHGLWEELLALLSTTIGSFVSGAIYGLGVDIVVAKPSVLIIAPALMDMRGNIYSSLASRLGSLLHLGHLEPKISRDPILIDNIKSTLSQTIIMGAYLGLIGSLFYLPKDIAEIVDLILASIFTGLLAMPLMMLITFTIAFLTFGKGLDPDSFSVPIITFTGDAISLPLLFISTLIVINLAYEPKLLLLFFSIASLALLVSYIVSRGSKYLKKVIYETMPIFALCGLLDVIAGLTLMINIQSMVRTIGILTMVPCFLEDCGAIGGVLAAKISTKLHLGIIEPQVVPSKNVLKDFSKMFFITLIIFPTIGAYGYVISSILGLTMFPLIRTVLTVLIAGFIMVFIVSLLAYLISIMSFRKGIDPDNVTIPILTSIVDVVGVTVFVFMFLFIKF